MNLKKLVLMLALLVLTGTTAFAQQTWYVNNGPTGNDGRNGLSATIPSPDDFVTGPKKTINNVLSYANASDVVVVANTGVDYGTGTGEPATLSITKALKFQSTGGTVNIASGFTVATGALATKVTFNSGAYQLSGGLTLTSGTLDNSLNLVTVNGGTITVGAVSTTTKVTGQLLYAGTVNFSYGATYTTADEFPASGTIGTLTTTAGNLTLKTSTLTVSGAITTAGTLDLGGNTVTRTNTGAQTDAFTGNVSNGTLAYSLGGGNVAINGAGSIPTVTAATSTSTARTLDINGPTAVTGTLSVSGKASVTSSGNTVATLGTSGYSGNVLTLSGTGTVGLGTALVTVNGSVLLSSTGLNAASAAQINFTNGAPLTVNGNVTNSAGVVATNAGFTNAGLIAFPDQAVTINGAVTLNGALSGTSDGTGATQNNGDIRFANTTTLVTITGAVTNSATSTAAADPTNAGVGPVSDNYKITFANTSGNVVTGGFVNSSAIPDADPNATGLTNTNNGVILFTARTTGTVGTTSSRTGLVSNTSSSKKAGNGLIDFLATATGTFYGTSIASSGADGGDITFGNHALNITGNITNARTVAGADIVVPVGAGTVTHSIGGYVVNSGKSMISIDLTGNDVVAITGRVESSSATGQVIFPNAGTGALSFGGLVVSAGTVSIPATNAADLTINGAVNISGGTASLLGAGGVAIVVAGDASFTGGTITTTGRTMWTLNSVNITVGGATANPTWSTAATALVVGVPVPTQLVNFVVGPANPTLAGALTVSSSGLAKAVEFSGGTLNVAGLLTFNTGKVNLAGAVNLIAQLAADPAFTNTAGYTSADNARITIDATGGNPGVRGAGDFGNLEFNSEGQTVVIGTGGAGITAKGTLYLTAGPVDNSVAGQNITFDNSTTIPTIVRNAGYFLAVPTFASNVNVTYIGGDKASGNELPVSPSTKLQNLTVATSIGNVAGKGVVTVASNTIVNGTINVYANQTLLIDGVTLTMKGAAITLTGDIANEGAGLLSFAATSGTTVTGAGYLPNLSIASGSTGNIIAGKAIINQLVGTDNMRNTAGDDFDPTTTSAQGTVTFVAGTNSATFTLTGVTYDGSMAGAVTTNGSGNTMLLGGNFVSSGTLTHNNGTINVGTFTYEQRGAAINLGQTSAWTGTGKLYIYQKDATTNSAFTLTAGGTGSTIGVNVEYNNADATAAEDDLNLAGAPLTISGNLTLTDGELVLGQNLTLTGSAFTITSNGTVSGASVLRLNAAVAPLTMSYTGTPTISNLRVSNDVNLAGTGTALTISTLFTHDGGVLNFGSKNLTFQTAFTRTAGTAAYQATTGYMIWDGSVGSALAVTQGTDGFSVPNLRITNSGANNVTLNAGATQGTVTVTSAFDLSNGVTTTQTFTTNGKFAIADGATVNYTSGLVSAAPAYAGSVTMVGKTFLTGETFPALLWPATGVTVTTLTINGAGSANTIALPGSRTVTTTLNLTKGVLALGGNTLTLGTGVNVYRTDLGSVTVGAGGFAFPSDNTTNVTYYANAGGFNTGVELPATVNNLTVSRNANGVNQAVTVASSVAINGTLTVKNNFTIPVAPPTVTVSVNGNFTVANDAATYALATNPVLTNNQSLVIGGASGDQTITVPNATPALNIGAITINKTAGNVLLAGGNLATGTVTFTSGDIVTGDFILYLPAPTTGAVAAGATSQGFTGASASSMVVGNVAKTLVNTGAIATSTESVSIFPVGTGVVYRPATLIFNTAFGVPTTPNATIVVKHVDSNPGGSSALPIKDGVAAGIDVSRYPNFYWNIYTVGSVGQSTIFDLGLTAGNFTDFDAPANVRIIRRHGQVGDITNDWLLQGLASGYDNEVNATTGFTAINRNSVGGLRTGGAVFTLGVKSNISVKTAIAKQWLVIPQGAKLVSLANLFQGNIGTLTYKAQSSNAAVATAEIVNPATVKLTPLTIGEAVVTVTAVDAANNDFFAFSFAVDSRLTDVETVAEIPTEFSLSQNFPNPFNPTTNIKFGLPKESNVTLKIYNILGEEVATLINKVMPAGYHTYNFDATRLASGMYIYRIEAGSFVQIKKMLLMK